MSKFPEIVIREVGEGVEHFISDVVLKLSMKFM